MRSDGQRVGGVAGGFPSVVIFARSCAPYRRSSRRTFVQVSVSMLRREKKRKKRKMLRLEPHEGVGVSSRKVTGRDGFIYLILVLSAGGSGPLKWQRCVRSIAADYSSDDGTLRADTLAGMTSL